MSVREDAIFECFAAAQAGDTAARTAESFVDVEEYENAVMYPAFAAWARRAGYPKIASLFLKVAGEEKLHANWLRGLHADLGVPREGADTARAKRALAAIEASLAALADVDPDRLVEDALQVAYRVEMRESTSIYPSFRDRARADGRADVAAVYQRVIDSEAEHARWFADALAEHRASRAAAGG